MNYTRRCSTPEGDGAGGDCTLPHPSPVLTRTKRSAWGVCMHAWLVGYQLEPLEGKERQKPTKPKRLLPRAA